MERKAPWAFVSILLGLQYFPEVGTKTKCASHHVHSIVLTQMHKSSGKSWTERFPGSGEAGPGERDSGGDAAQRSPSVSAPGTKPIPLQQRVADRPAVISRQVMPRSVPPGQPRNPHRRRMGEGSEDVGAGRGAPTPRRGGPAAASGPQPGQTGAQGSCCVNYLPSVAAGCSLWSMRMCLTFSNLPIVYFRVYICSFWQKVGIS